MLVTPDTPGAMNLEVYDDVGLVPMVVQVDTKKHTYRAFVEINGSPQLNADWGHQVYESPYVWLRWTGPVSEMPEWLKE